MALTNELIYEFVKATKDEAPKSTETTVYGTTVEYNGSIWVQLDGSDRYTPVSTTTDMKAGERVSVTIKNHTATVTGNLSSPAARTDDVKEIGSKISEFDIIVAGRVTTDQLNAINASIELLRAETAKIKDAEIINAQIETLAAKYANIDRVTAIDVDALNAEIENLRATFGDFTDIEADNLEAINAELDNLKAYNAEFTYLSAIKAEIENLDADYATIDFANIGEAAIEELFAKSGIIKDIVVSEGHITGELVGVTIKGDLIEAGTLKADRLVVKGSDGKYYKLNTNFEAMPGVEPVEEDAIHGSVIVARSVTAEKVAVDDLVAFDATIGGFHISDTSIYSGVKASVDNTTKGLYLGSDGQLALGDSNNYLKYYKTADGTYKLAISAGSIIFSSSGKTVEETVNDTLSGMEIGARNLIRNSKNLIFRDYYFEDYTLTVTHDAITGNVTVETNAIEVSNDGKNLTLTSLAYDLISNEDGDVHLS